jgi:hypothetical protein
MVEFFLGLFAAANSLSYVHQRTDPAQGKEQIEPWCEWTSGCIETTRDPLCIVV